MADTPLTIIVPCLDEAATIGPALQDLQRFRNQGAEVIVVDGGSSDGTPELCQALCDQFLFTERGRALQMNAGAARASSENLLFLHADTSLPDGAVEFVADALEERCWGRFDTDIVGRSRLLPVVAAAMNLRSRLTGIATGDQAIFVRRRVFEAIGSFPEQPLMEDLEFSTRMRRIQRPCCLRQKVRTSGRRWDDHGSFRTILLMWRLRIAYALGADTTRLRALYVSSGRIR